MIEGNAYTLQTLSDESFWVCEKDGVPVESDSRFFVRNRQFLPVVYEGIGIYVQPVNGESLTMQIHPAQGLNPLGGVGRTDRYGNLQTADQDQFTEILNLYLAQKLDDLTVDANTNLLDKTITISTTGVVPVAGNHVCLKEGTAFYQGRIKTVTPVSGNQYTLALNTPLDFAFTTAGGCSLTNVDLRVNGSVTPIIFAVSPALLDQGVFWDITRILMIMRDDTPMDDAKFAGSTALTNGLVFRIKYNGKYKNLFTIRNNADFRLQAYDVQYTTNAPAGEYGFSFRRSFNGKDKNGVVARLVNDVDPDEFQLVVQDDLTVLTVGKALIQGHVGE
jgi:hypothetical protein